MRHPEHDQWGGLAWRKGRRCLRGSHGLVVLANRQHLQRERALRGRRLRVVLDRLATPPLHLLDVAPRERQARHLQGRLFVGRVGIEYRLQFLAGRRVLTGTQLDIGELEPHAGIVRVLLQDAGVMLARTRVIASLREYCPPARRAS